MIFLLNNDIAYNKPILKMPAKPALDVSINGLRMMGFSKYLVQLGDIRLIFYSNNDDSKNVMEFIKLYLDYGFEYMLQYISGEFFLILIDENLNYPESKIYVAQDRLGKCPLYTLQETNTSECKIFGFSTTMARLELDTNIYETKWTIRPFEPGTYSYFTYTHNVLSCWKPILEKKPFFIGWPKNHSQDVCCDSSAVTNIHNTLKRSVLKDLPTTPIACLLSGGINSSIIAKILCESCPTTKTFTVGFDDSDDLKYAQKIAMTENDENLHTNFKLSEAQYIRSIPTVIELLETDDIATIRYGTALYLLLEYIYEKTNIRDIFTGDGANEVMGGYLNFCYMKNEIEFDYKCVELLKNYHKTGALYKKLFSHFGMRWYRPFLNDTFVNMYMDIPLELRYKAPYENPYIGINKGLLRTAVAEQLPNWVLFRTPEPGYDSISGYRRRIEQIISEGLKTDEYEYEYYRGIYEQKFPHAATPREPSPPQDPTMRNLDIFIELNTDYQDRTL